DSGVSVACRERAADYSANWRREQIRRAPLCSALAGAECAAGDPVRVILLPNSAPAALAAKEFSPPDRVKRGSKSSRPPRPRATIVSEQSRAFLRLNVSAKRRDRVLANNIECSGATPFRHGWRESITSRKVSHS